MKNIKTYIAITVIACAMSVAAPKAGAVAIFEESYGNSLGYFYIFNNTLATMTMSGNFGQTGLPAAINPLSLSADANLQELWIETSNRGSLIYTLAPQSGGDNNSFQITGYSDSSITFWNLEAGTDSSWNTTGGSSASGTGVTSINTCNCGPDYGNLCDCGSSCFIQQIWNNNYVVTLVTNINNDNSQSPMVLILFVNPNTPDMVYQSAMPNAPDSTTWSLSCDQF